MNSAEGPAQLEAKRGTKFLDLIEKHFPCLWNIYRGQQNESWKLLPKAGRPPFYCPERRQRRSDPESLASSLPPDDIMWFREWRKDAIAFSKSIGELDEFECLAYAQHYGLATRLLDWTFNPLVALFFAVEAHPTHDAVDGAVFAYSDIVWVEGEKIEEQLEKYPRKVALYKPRPFDRRILCQSAVFTFHPEPHMPPLVDGPLAPAKIVIPSGVKGEIQSWLNTLGVSRKTLFPNLEGLSASTNWWYTHLRANSKDSNSS